MSNIIDQKIKIISSKEKQKIKLELKNMFTKHIEKIIDLLEKGDKKGIISFLNAEIEEDDNKYLIDLINAFKELQNKSNSSFGKDNLNSLCASVLHVIDRINKFRFHIYLSNYKN